MFPILVSLIFLRNSNAASLSLFFISHFHTHFYPPLPSPSFISSLVTSSYIFQSPSSFSSSLFFSVLHNIPFIFSFTVPPSILLSLSFVILFPAFRFLPSFRPSPLLPVLPLPLSHITLLPDCLFSPLPLSLPPLPPLTPLCPLFNKVSIEGNTRRQGLTIGPSETYCFTLPPSPL